MTQGAVFSRVYELHLHRNTWPPKPIAAPRPPAQYTRQTLGRETAAQSSGRPQDRKEVQGSGRVSRGGGAEGGCACAVAKQRLSLGVLVTPRTLSGATGSAPAASPSLAPPFSPLGPASD